MSQDGLWFPKKGSKGDDEWAASLRSLRGTTCKPLEDTVTTNPLSSSWGTFPGLCPLDCYLNTEHLYKVLNNSFESNLYTFILSFSVAKVRLMMDNFI